ncbi:hypothetical protein [Euzebya sp.]|uniref:hypothetical protein n=1 Tax=Euzebya sp. TaxID=1971409 RepID=UPI0035158DD4
MGDPTVPRPIGLLPRLAVVFIAVALAAIAVVALLTFLAARAQVTSFAAQDRADTADLIGVALHEAYDAADG